MKSAPLPPDESKRLKALEEHRLMDTLPEAVYDDITRIASELCGTPIALLSLVGEEKQWLKSRQGFDIQETPREYSFCAHAILNPDDVFVVEDARYDERFHDNPLTTGEPNIVFYAGVPVQDSEGYALGTLCVIDNRPRELNQQKIDSLRALAKLVNTHFKLRKATIQLEESNKRINQAQDLTATIVSAVQSLESHSDPNQKEHISNIRQAAEALNELLQKKS